MLRDRVTGEASDRASLDTIKAQAGATAQVLHDNAVLALAAELRNDPEQIGYAGKTAGEIQFLLTHSKDFFADAPGPSLMERIVKQTLAELVTVPADLVLFKDGTVEGDHPEISKRIGLLASATGLADAELQAPSTVQVVSRHVEPRIGIIWQGIAYCENVPSIEVINEALAL
jgi:hypothetical protein